MRKLLLIVALGVLVLLAGCASPTQDPSDAINGSEAVADVTLESEDGQALVNLTLAENVEQNDETCTSSYNPATGVTTTSCDDDWHDATITHIEMTDGDETMATVDGEFNGESIRFQIPWESGEYYFHLTAENGGTTVFSIDVTEDMTLDGAGYDDDY